VTLLETLESFLLRNKADVRLTDLACASVLSPDLGTDYPL
jgi:hypothetical protein